MADKQLKEEEVFVLSNLDVTPRNFDTVTYQLTQEYEMNPGKAKKLVEGLNGKSVQYIEIYEMGIDRRCCLTDMGRQVLKSYRS